MRITLNPITDAKIRRNIIAMKGLGFFNTCGRMRLG